MHRFAILAVLVLAAPPARAQHGYSDSYPKNADIDVRNYVFELVLSDETDLIHSRTTVDARFIGAADELRLDLIERSDVVDGRGMAVESVSMDGSDLAVIPRRGRIRGAAGLWHQLPPGPN